MPPQNTNTNTNPASAVPSNAITALPTAFKPRRRRAQHTRLRRPVQRRRQQSTTSEQHKQQQQQKDQTIANDDEDARAEDMAVAALSGMSDTHVAILTLRSQWPGEATLQLPQTPPIVLRCQIHALVADPTIIDHELDNLLSDNTIRHIRLPSMSSSINNDKRRDAYILTSDFNANDNSILRTLFTSVFHTCRDALVDIRDLTHIYSRDTNVDIALNELVREGFLIMIDETTYGFTVPGMAKFTQNRTEGEKQILRLLKSAPYREMPLDNLEMRTLKKTIFTSQWHVRDVVGSGIANTVTTTIGIIVRLSHSHSHSH